MEELTNEELGDGGTPAIKLFCSVRARRKEKEQNELPKRRQEEQQCARKRGELTLLTIWTLK